MMIFALVAAMLQGQAMQSPPAFTELHVKVVERAQQLLATQERWNRTDSGECPAGEPTLSLRCAIRAASAEIIPDYQGGGAVMDEARLMVDFIESKKYDSRLNDYNNDPATTFADIQAFLRILHNRIVRQSGSPPAQSANVAAPAASSKAAEAGSCDLELAGDRWQGSCGPMEDVGSQPKLDLKTTAAITSGFWRRDAMPTLVWSGRFTNVNAGDAPLELEEYRDGTAVLRTMWGWFPVVGLQAKAKELHFHVQMARQVAPNAVDHEILERAAAILSDETVWNRADTRECPAAAKTWSIYCAVEKAEIEVTGGFHHRRPAAELVREIVDERTKDNPLGHRMMYYNNAPSTHLADVQSLFKDAIGRIK